MFGGINLFSYLCIVIKKNNVLTIKIKIMALVKIKKENPIKAYKGFEMDFTCKGFQYEVGKEYHTDGDVELCKNGFHACKNPIEVFSFYAITESRFAEVELWGDVSINDDGDTTGNICSSDIRIVREIDVREMTRIAMELYRDKHSDCKYSDVENDSMVVTETSPTIVSVGNNTNVSLCNSVGRIFSGGDHAKIVSNGDFNMVFSNGKYSNVVSSGTLSVMIANGGHTSVNVSGSGNKIYSTGHLCTINADGYGQYIYSNGSMARINVNADYSEVSSTGDNAVIASLSVGTKAKAKKGSWITLSDWKYDDELKEHRLSCVKTEYVDGEKIKEDTWYVIEDGEFKEVDY